MVASVDWRATVAVGVAVVAFAGCGSSDPEGEADEPAAGAAAAPVLSPNGDPGVSTGDSRLQLQENLRDVHEGLVQGNPPAVCWELSDAAQVRLAREMGIPPGDCGKAVERFIARRKRAGVEDPPLPSVPSIDLEGRVAIALVEVPGREPFRVRVINERSSWHLPRLDENDPSGFHPEP
jgi:hypothetical protein